MKFGNGILWFRNDLRLHDHEPLIKALEQVEQIYPVYILDERHFGETAFGFPKTGAFRAKFLLESLADLRKRLQERGSELIILKGKPEEILPQIAQKLEIDMVFDHKEVTQEETCVEEKL